jgi:ABC-type sugar transport system ATPase subunit
MSNVEFSGVSKRYGTLTALDSLDLDVRSGEFVSLLGPSGSGKSTTLNLLAGLINSDSGEISIDGRVVNHLSPDKRHIAMVFQNYALYPHMTVRENLAFPLRAKGRRYGQPQIDEAIARVAPGLGLENLLHRYPKELSGGQQQRVALGRAMIRDPSVFLLDEPLSNLDVRLRIQMRRDIKALHDRVGATTIYVTHDQGEALGLSDRIAVFNEGRLQQYASPADIYNHPVNTFVANFVGERGMNFVEGELEEDNNELIFATTGLRLAIGKKAAAQRPSHGVILGVRSEGIRPAGDGEVADIVGTVDQVELSGPDRILFISVENGSEITCRADAMIPIGRSDRVGMVFDRKRLNLFDAHTGVALPLAA